MGVSHFSSVLSTFPVFKKSISDDYTLTAQEAADACILEITPSASKAIIFPSAIEGRVVILVNKASATYTATVKVGASGTGVAVAAAKSAILRCTDTDFVRVSADA